MESLPVSPNFATISSSKKVERLHMEQLAPNLPAPPNHATTSSIWEMVKIVERMNKEQLDRNLILGNMLADLRNMTSLGPVFMKPELKWCAGEIWNRGLKRHRKASIESLFGPKPNSSIQSVATMLHKSYEEVENQCRVCMEATDGIPLYSTLERMETMVGMLQRSITNYPTLAESLPHQCHTIENYGIVKIAIPPCFSKTPLPERFQN